MDGSGNPTSDFFRLGTAGSKASSKAAFEGCFDHDQLFTEHKPETKQRVFTFEKIKLFDEKTGKWRNKRRDVNAEVSNIHTRQALTTGHGSRQGSMQYRIYARLEST